MNSKVTLAARIVLGLMFFVFGLNGFLDFIPKPPSIPEGAMNFMTAMAGTGYFFPVLKATETICGILLLTGFAAPLALIILAPIMIQIVLFHSFLTPGLENLVMPVIMVALHITAATAYWHLYRPLFKRNPTR
ncbi:hypothetical protein D3C87_89280 [compost metagenome]